MPKKTGIKRERWNVKGRKKYRIVARDYHGKFITFAKPSKEISVRKLRAERKVRKEQKIVRVWAKIEYKSKRGSGHDFFLQCFIQRKIAWEDRHRLIGELVTIIAEEFGTDISEMCEYGMENLEFDRRAMTRNEIKNGEYRAESSITESREGEEYGILRTAYSQIRYEYSSYGWERA